MEKWVTCPRCKNEFIKRGFEDPPKKVKRWENLSEMINSPKYKAHIKLIREVSELGIIDVYPPLPKEV